GFDARAKHAVYPSEYVYFLRDTQPQPLSTDLMLWPSVFDEKNSLAMLPDGRYRFELCDDLPQMKHCLSQWKSPQAFRQLSNTRVSEHAPFFVYGLYLIEIRS